MFTKLQSQEERLAVWRSFRKNFPADGTALDAVKAFESVKLQRRSIDYYTPENWPTPFEAVAEDLLCQSGLTLVMASTLIHLGFIKNSECQFDVVSNYITGQDGLVLVYDNSVYNFLPGEIVTVEFAKENSLVFSSHIIASDKLCC
jgi:hypothetical protein